MALRISAVLLAGALALPQSAAAALEPQQVFTADYALSFFEVDAGRITSTREYWVVEAYEEPAAERARWFEQM
jgi:hypothetical protein